MEQEGIIRPCPETTECVHNIVTVVKKYGSQPKQVPDPQCSLHYFVGGCSSWFQKWPVLLHP